jgi:hypothetical protein
MSGSHKAPPDLAQTQQLFWRAITHPTGVNDFLNACSAEDRQAFAQVFSETPGFGRLERVSVYADAYFFRLHDALAETFPTLRWLLGAEHFHNLATDYVLAEPSTSPNLHAFGDRLPEYLGRHPLLSRFPAATDIASVERALARALHAADRQCWTREHLARLAGSEWATLRVQLVASAQLLRNAHDVRPFHEARQQDTDVPLVEAVHPPLFTLIWRKGHRPFFRTLSPAEGHVLSALDSGVTFREACAIAQRHRVGPGQVAAYLQRWVSDQLLTRRRQA